MCGLKDVKSTPKLHWTWQKAVNNTRWNWQRVHQQGLRASLLLLSCSGGLWARRETISTLEHLCLEAATLIDCLGCSADRDELIPTQRSPTRTNEWSKQKHKHTNTFKSPESEWVCVCVCIQYMLTKMALPHIQTWQAIKASIYGLTSCCIWREWPQLQPETSGQMQISWFTEFFFWWWRTSAPWACLKIKTWQT